MSDASDRTRRIRGLAEFYAKTSGMSPTFASQSSDTQTSSVVGASFSKMNNCCELPIVSPPPPPTPAPSNYAAYFTVTEPGRAAAAASAFSIPAGGAFTIEWWQTDVSMNAFQNRHIFSFGTIANNEFACVMDQGAFITRIAGQNYPYDPTGATLPTIEYGNWFTTMLNVQNHFAITRDQGGANIRIYKNGGFLGEFRYPDAISVTNTGTTKLTLRNQSVACAATQIFGEFHSFRWTAAGGFYRGDTMTPAANFTPPPVVMPALSGNVITINNFPTSGSVVVDGMTVTRFDGSGLPTC